MGQGRDLAPMLQQSRFTAARSILIMGLILIFLEYFAIKNTIELHEWDKSNKIPAYIISLWNNRSRNGDFASVKINFQLKNDKEVLNCESYQILFEDFHKYKVGERLQIVPRNNSCEAPLVRESIAPPVRLHAAGLSIALLVGFISWMAEVFERTRRHPY